MSSRVWILDIHYIIKNGVFRPSSHWPGCERLNFNIWPWPARPALRRVSAGCRPGVGRVSAGPATLESGQLTDYYQVIIMTQPAAACYRPSADKLCRLQYDYADLL